MINNQIVILSLCLFAAPFAARASHHQESSFKQVVLHKLNETKLSFHFYTCIVSC